MLAALIADPIKGCCEYDTDELRLLEWPGMTMGIDEPGYDGETPIGMEGETAIGMDGSWYMEGLIPKGIEDPSYAEPTPICIPLLG